MRHLRPLSEQQVSPLLFALYQEVKHAFAIETVPLFFQYIANFEQYFTFLWKRIHEDMQSESFQEASQQITRFAKDAVSAFPTPSVELATFVSRIHPLEKKQIAETVATVERMNSMLLLLLLDIREGMKSIHIDTERLVSSATHGKPLHTDSSPDVISGERKTNYSLQHHHHALVPLFGSHELVMSHYPDFFSYIVAEMESLRKTELYLQKRVELERKGLQSLTVFVQPLGCSFKEFLLLTSGKPYIAELLYLLTDDFPSQIPHVVFTAAVMKRVLLFPAAYSLQGKPI